LGSSLRWSDGLAILSPVQIVEEITPFGIMLFDKAGFPDAFPGFHRIFAGDSLVDTIMLFGIDEAGEAVFGAKFEPVPSRCWMMRAARLAVTPM
jgi:hypothetical protein